MLKDELFRMSEGPWEQLFEGVFQEMPVGIFMNPESIILTLILEKEGGKTKSAVVELYKAFHSTGETETFTETLPREVLLITKHDEKETLRFFLLGGKPSYVEWKEEEFMKEIDLQLKRLKTSAKMIKDVSKAYDLTLKEIKECSDKIKEAFFSQPLLIPITATNSHFTGGEYASTSAAATGERFDKSLMKGEIIFGITKDGKQVIEPLALFTKTMISDGKPSDRLHAMHVIAESCLLSGITPIIFEWGDWFSGLHEATGEPGKLTEYRVNAEPIGFPIKTFSLGKELKIDLALANPKSFAETFGLGDNKSTGIITRNLSEKKAHSLKELSAMVSNEKAGDNLSAYEISRAARILLLIDSMYEGLFDSQINLDEIIKGTGSAAVGRASILDLGKGDEKTTKLAIHNVLAGIIKSSPEKSALKRMVLLPNSETIIPISDRSLVSGDIVNALAQLNNRGSGFCLSIGNIIDAKKEIRENVQSQINIISGNDMGIQLEGRKSYRALIRPGLSRCSEKNA